MSDHHDRGELHSARLLPCASSFSEEIVEGNHDIIAEGTGVEPYTPWPLPRPGDGGPSASIVSEMRPHRRTPRPSVFCVERVIPNGRLDMAVSRRRSCDI